MDAPAEPSKGDWYRYDDGTAEIVFAVEGDRVLTVREYEGHETFSEAVGAGTYVGEHDEVIALPDVETFSDREP